VKSTISIVPFDDHERVSFYTLCFQDEETEADKFLDKFPEGCDNERDVDIIIKWIDEIGERGALERYFRPEGRRHDHVWAVPIETASLRLYVIRLSENIVIIGNGDIKSTKTYNEDPILKDYVELLQEVDGYIRSRIQKGKRK
jgi:hypothetical protein